MIAVAAVFGALDDSNRSTSREACLAAPLKGDRYVVNVASLLKEPQSKSMDGVMRVRSVSGDSIQFDAPTFFYGSASGVTKDIRSGKIFIWHRWLAPEPQAEGLGYQAPLAARAPGATVRSARAVRPMRRRAAPVAWDGRAIRRVEPRQ